MRTPRKDSCGYAHLHIMFFITTKFHEILLSGFGGVALTRETGLTDGRTDGSKTLYPPQLVARGIQKGMSDWLNVGWLKKYPLQLVACSIKLWHFIRVFPVTRPFVGTNMFDPVTLDFGIFFKNVFLAYDFEKLVLDLLHFTWTLL